MKRKNYLLELHDAIMHRFPEHITIAQASELVGVSKSKLKADFHKEYGMSYYSYFRNERMKLAAKLLLETDQKIADISVSVGYENSSKFSRAFCDVMGCSPSAYRRIKNKPVLFPNELDYANRISDNKQGERSCT